MCAAGWAAHKTKQAMTKHLALLASLGKLGLSEHMMLEADLRRHTEAGGRTVQRKVSATLRHYSLRLYWA